MSQARSAQQEGLQGGARTIGLVAASRLPEAFRLGYAEEVELRRPFLWHVAAVGAGALLYFAADREPALGLCAAVFLGAALLAFLTRRHASAHVACIALACLAAGFTAGAWRAARVVPRIGVGELTGFVEEADACLVAEAKGAGACDELGCVATAVDGRVIALINEPGALFEDFERTSVVITPPHAPDGCAAPVVIDRDTLSRAPAPSRCACSKTAASNGRWRAPATKTGRGRPEAVSRTFQEPARKSFRTTTTPLSNEH